MDTHLITVGPLACLSGLLTTNCVCRCTQDAGVRKVLVRKCLCLDMTGITGKKLLPSKRKGKSAP